jgi:hypothetical protein
VKALYIYEIHQRVMMMIMPNHSVQVQVYLAPSQIHNCKNIKMTGEAASADTVADEKFFIAL